MTTAGIIAEYNPFHNGHKYQLEKVREVTNCDNIVVIMSGSFLQRGTPAIISKYERAAHAISNGADMVLELPVCYSTASAELFALAAITTFNSLGIMDYLAFGCEDDDISMLSKIAELLSSEPNEYGLLLKKELAKGTSFPKARAHAVSAVLSNINAADILSKPNNILAIEYIKALIRTKSHIKPFPIKRIDNGYHSLDSHSDFASAAAIRNMIVENSQYENFIPDSVYKSLYGQKIIMPNDFSDMLAYKLTTTANYSDYYDVSENLSNRICNNKNNFVNVDSFVNLLASKNETCTHLYRALTHILLDIKKQDIDTFINNGYSFFVNPLSVNRKSGVMKLIKSHGSIPIINKFGDFYKNADSVTRSMLDINVKADSIYNYRHQKKTGISLPNDFTIINSKKMI